MKENKNIERLFQEKFKDFEVQPPQDAWAAIEKRLNEKKKKRRVIPIWFKASGIAASLVLGFFLFNTIQDSLWSNVEVNPKDNEEKAPNWVNQNSNQENGNSNFKQESKNKNGVFVQPGQVVTNVDAVSNENLENNIQIKNEVNSVSRTETNLQGTKRNQSVRNTLKKNKSKETWVQTDKKKSSVKNSNWIKIESQESLADGNSTKTGNKNRKESIASQTKTTEQLSQSTNTPLANQETEKGKIAIEKEKQVLNQNNSQLSNGVATSEKIENKLITQQAALVSEGVVDFNKTNAVDLIKTNSIDSVLVSKKGILAEIETAQDSSQVAQVLEEENALEKLLKEKEEGENADEKEKEEKRSKWAVSTNAAPVYFNSLAQGSPLDEQFASNSKSYQNTMSYGAGVQYQVTPKLALRTGVNSLAWSYDTQNVYHSSVLKTSIVQQQTARNTLNVDRTQTARNIALYNKRSDVYGDVANFTQNEVGSLSQQIGYLEVPLEMSYKLLDRKFGIEVVGGMSTLFLQQNEVKLLDEGMEMNIGKANNLNNIHFSSNVGLGFKYSFLKDFQANFQPMFKYQINTFSDNAGNFKPYVIGLYTGLSYHF